MPSILPVLKHVDSFTVIGFMVRTQNSDEFNQEKAKLPKLWQQFYSSDLITNTTIFGVYSNYESDANGLYSVIAGVNNNDNNHPALHTIKVNSGNYLIFQGKGSMPQAVIETWQRIWDYFTEGSFHQRCFMTDFEAYSNGDEVSIYIGVK
jgi:predicted transcriptional regulator YdeE